MGPDCQIVDFARLMQAHLQGTQSLVSYLLSDIHVWTVLRMLVFLLCCGCPMVIAMKLVVEVV